MEKKRTCRATLKGVVLIMAIDTGLVKKDWRGTYNISPFLRFWDAFIGYLKFAKEKDLSETENLLDVLSKDIENFTPMFDQECNGGGEQDHKDSLFQLKDMVPCLFGGVFGAILVQLLKLII